MTDSELKISFIAENESHKREMEKSLDELFNQTNYRRESTKQEGENLKNITIIYKDTGVRH